MVGGGVGIMEKTFRRYFKIPWYFLLLLLALLAVLAVANLSMLFGLVRPLQEGKGEESVSEWREGGGSEMWDMFAVRITPNKAVLSIEGDKQFNVSVHALYWAPFTDEPRAFLFRLYDKRIDFWGVIQEAELVSEKTFVANKSRDELDYDILFDFTVTLKIGGAHLYEVVGTQFPNATNLHWDCIVNFSMNISR
jgi:hypothetical protein